MTDRSPGDDLELTPTAYRCPACGQISRLVVQRPRWVCPNCLTRLIPADLRPGDGENGRGEDGGKS